ncbi:MAG: hypothetical protein OHK0015_36920 [Chloroflexi bacterium OHK40]
MQRANHWDPSVWVRHSRPELCVAPGLKARRSHQGGVNQLRHNGPLPGGIGRGPSGQACCGWRHSPVGGVRADGSGTQPTTRAELAATVVATRDEMAKFCLLLEGLKGELQHVALLPLNLYITR